MEKQSNLQNINQALERYLTEKVFEKRFLETPEKTLTKTSIRNGQEKIFGSNK